MSERFTLQQKGAVFRGVFKAYNEKVVHCILVVEHQNTALKGFYKFEGRAFCNSDAGDVFDLEVGKKIAFERAIDKYKKSLDRIIKRIGRVMTNNYNNIDELKIYMR